MPPKLTVCTTPACPTLCSGGRCDGCKQQAEQARGTAAQRGYGTAHRNRFRKGVLRKHPTCVVCRTARATVADHYPVSRVDLIAQGLDPNDPQYGRGLCHSCHGRETQANPAQRGGWNAR